MIFTTQLVENFNARHGVVGVLDTIEYRVDSVLCDIFGLCGREKREIEARGGLNRHCHSLLSKILVSANALYTPTCAAKYVSPFYDFSIPKYK